MNSAENDLEEELFEEGVESLRTKLLESLFELKTQFECLSEGIDYERSIIQLIADNGVRGQTDEQKASMTSYFEARKYQQLKRAIYKSQHNGESEDEEANQYEYEFDAELGAEDENNGDENGGINENAKDHDREEGVVGHNESAENIDFEALMGEMSMVLRAKEEKSKLLLLIYGEVFIDALRNVDSGEATLFIHDSISEEDQQLPIFEKVSSVYIKTMLIFKQDKHTHTRSLSGIHTKFGFEEGHQEMESDGEEFCLVNMKNWFCSCYHYQQQFSHTKVKQSVPSIETMLGNLTIGGDKRVLLEPVPICSHLLSLLIIKLNIDEFPSYLEGKITELYVDSPNWISIHTNMYGV